MNASIHSTSRCFYCRNGSAWRCLNLVEVTPNLWWRIPGKSEGLRPFIQAIVSLMTSCCQTPCHLIVRKWFMELWAGGVIPSDSIMLLREQLTMSASQGWPGSLLLLSQVLKSRPFGSCASSSATEILVWNAPSPSAWSLVGAGHLFWSQDVVTDTHLDFLSSCGPFVKGGWNPSAFLLNLAGEHTAVHSL